jgi:hypothetical protein
MGHGDDEGERENRTGIRTDRAGGTNQEWSRVLVRGNPKLTPVSPFWDEARFPSVPSRLFHQPVLGPVPRS